MIKDLVCRWREFSS